MTEMQTEATPVVQTGPAKLLEVTDLVKHFPIRGGGLVRRVVAEVRSVNRFDLDAGRVVTDEWFHPGPDGRAVRNPLAPIPVAMLDELVDHGYDPALHEGGMP